MEPDLIQFKGHVHVLCGKSFDLLKLMVWQCIPLELSVLGVSDETIETSGRLQSKHHFFISCDELRKIRWLGGSDPELRVFIFRMSYGELPRGFVGIRNVATPL